MFTQVTVQAQFPDNDRLKEGIARRFDTDLFNVDSNRSLGFQFVLRRRAVPASKRF